MGSGVSIYHGVDFTYGYNLSIGDGVTIRQRALFNDRGGITIGKNAVIGSFSRIFSHSHDPSDFENVTLMPTDHRRRARASPATPLCWPGRTCGRADWWAPSRSERTVDYTLMATDRLA